MRLPSILLTVICCLAIAGCGTLKSERALESTAIGMSKADVLKTAGHPSIVRGTLNNDYGQTVEVWEYKVGQGKHFQQLMTETAFTAITAGAGAPQLLSSGATDRYWFYFVDGSLAGWGRAGDWKRDAGRICVMKFKPGSNLSQGI